MSAYFNRFEWSVPFVDGNFERLNAMEEFEYKTKKIKLNLDIDLNENDDQKEILRCSTTWPDDFSIIDYEIFIKGDFDSRSTFVQVKPELDNILQEYEYPEEVTYEREVIEKFVKDGEVTFVVIIAVREYTFYANFGITEYLPFFNNDLFSDFKIVCNDRTIPVHRNIIYAKSKVFAKMLLEGQLNEAVVTDFDGDVILEMVRFMYTEKVVSWKEMAPKLIYTAKKYEIKGLEKICIKALDFYLCVDNVLDYLPVAHQLEVEGLFDSCIELIKMTFKELKGSEKWSKINGKLFMVIADKFYKLKKLPYHYLD